MKSKAKRKKCEAKLDKSKFRFCTQCLEKKPLSEFGERVYKGKGATVLLKSCKSCNAAQHGWYAKNSTVICEAQRRPEHKVHARELAAAPHRKATVKTSTALYHATPIGKAKLKRGWDARRAKVMASPGLRIQESLTAGMRERLRGQRRDEQSANLSSYTEFATIDDMLEHFKSEMESKPGMTMENYGIFWSIAHKIPQKYYDFEDAEEIRRCNAKANLGCDYETKDNPANELTNKQKSDRIPADEELEAIGRQYWPKVFGDGLSAQQRVELQERGRVRERGVNGQWVRGQ